MKLSNKCHYAIGALFDMAFYGAGQATQIKDIATRQSIPARFLEQIFQELKRAGIVVSKRGPTGGYTLAKPPSDIRIGDVVRALEGAIALSDVKSDPGLRKKSATDTRRVTDSVLNDVSKRIEACFDEVCIGDICNRATELGILRAAAQRISYSI